MNIDTRQCALFGVWIDDRWAERMGETWFSLDRRVANAMCVNINGMRSQMSMELGIVYELDDDGGPVMGGDK